MNVKQFITNVNSERPEELIAFYRDVVGLTPNPDVAPGAFMVGSATFIALIVEGHSKIAGMTKEPARVMLNFMVDDLASEQERLETHGVTFVRGATNEPGVGVFATFLDPDGNQCQLIEYGASSEVPTSQ